MTFYLFIHIIKKEPIKSGSHSRCFFKSPVVLHTTGDLKFCLTFYVFIHIINKEPIRSGSPFKILLKKITRGVPTTGDFFCFPYFFLLLKIREIIPIIRFITKMIRNIIFMFISIISKFVISNTPFHF